MHDAMTNGVMARAESAEAIVAEVRAKYPLKLVFSPTLHLIIYTYGPSVARGHVPLLLLAQFPLSTIPVSIPTLHFSIPSLLILSFFYPPLGGVAQW